MGNFTRTASSFVFLGLAVCLAKLTLSQALDHSSLQPKTQPVSLPLTPPRWGPASELPCHFSTRNHCNGPLPRGLLLVNSSTDRPSSSLLIEFIACASRTLKARFQRGAPASVARARGRARNKLDLDDRRRLSPSMFLVGRVRSRLLLARISSVRRLVIVLPHCRRRSESQSPFALNYLSSMAS